MSVLTFEEFGAPSAPAPTPAAPAAAAEADRLQAFENGYREGWEDAVKDAVETRDRIRRSLAARLEDLAFTHAEVRAAFRREFEEAVAAVAEAVLPRLAIDGFGPSLAATVLAEFAPEEDSPVELRVAEGDLAAVRTVFTEVTGLDVVLVSDPTLEVGQAIFGRGGEARHVDHAALAERAADRLREHLSNPHVERIADHA